MARWRRLEARLGYDSDPGPDDLIESADTLATHWGLEAVEEAFCATPGSKATETLASEVSFTRQYGQACNFSAVLTGIEPLPRNAWAPPWVAAEEVAARVRAWAGIRHGHLRNTRLADLLATPLAGISPCYSLLIRHLDAAIATDAHGLTRIAK